MIFPERYYWDDAQQVVVYYDNDSSGTLCPERITTGRPFEHQVVQHTGKSKRTIVLNSWDSLQLKSPKFIQNIHALLQNGFSVLQVDGQKIRPILHLAHINPHPQALFNLHDVHQLLADHQPRISFDQAFILDYFQCHTFSMDSKLSTEKRIAHYCVEDVEKILFYADLERCHISPENRRLLAQHKILFVNLSDMLSIESIDALLPYAQSILLHDEEHDQHAVTIQQKIQCLLRYIADDKLYGITLNYHTIQQLTDYIAELSRENQSMPVPTRLQQLRAELFSSDVFLMQGQAKLLTLDCEMLPNQLLTKYSQLKSLKILRSSASAASILRANIGLLDLTLQLNEEFSIDYPLQLTQLINLSLESTNNSMDTACYAPSFANFLASTPKLKRLKLRGLNLVDVEHITSGPFDKLSVIILSYTRLKAELLHDMLRKSIHIEAMFIHDCHIIGELQPITSCGLKKLIIENNALTFEPANNLYPFIAACSQLELLTLEYPYWDEPLPELNMTNLQRVVIRGGYVSYQNIAQLLKASPHLSMIQFDGATYAEHDEQEIDELRQNISNACNMIEYEINHQIMMILPCRTMPEKLLNRADSIHLLNEFPRVESLVIAAFLLPKLPLTTVHTLTSIYIYGFPDMQEALINSKRVESIANDALDLSDLERIKIVDYLNEHDSLLSANALATVLATRVREVTLHACFLTGNLHVKTNRSLVKIDLSDSILSFENLKALHRLNKHLKIDLSNCCIVSAESAHVKQFITQNKINFQWVIYQEYKVINAFPNSKLRLEQWAYDQGYDPKTRYYFKEELHELNEAIHDGQSVSAPAPVEVNGPAFTPYQPESSSEIVLDDNTWSQALLIHRLSAYLRLKYPDDQSVVELIRRLNEGICAAISQFYAATVSQGTLDQGLTLWSHKLQAFYAWDALILPNEDSLIGRALEQLWFFTYEYYVQLKSFTTHVVVVPSVDELLKASIAQTLYLANSWHQILLLHKDNRWLIFDPNYKKGVAISFCVGQEKLIADEIYRILGHGLTIHSDQLLQFDYHWDAISDWDLLRFFDEGGFSSLLNSPRHHQIFSQFNAAQRSIDALEGIFFISNNNKPFWFLGMHRALDDTLPWLERYYQLNSSACMQKLKTGFKLLNKDDCKFVARCIPRRWRQHGLGEWIIRHIGTLQFSSVHRTPTLSIAAPSTPQVLDDRLPDVAPSPSTVIDFPVEKVQDVYAQVLQEDVTPFLLEVSLSIPTARMTQENNQFLVKKTSHLSVPDRLDQFDLVVLQSEGQNTLLRFTDEKMLVNYLHHLQQVPQAKTRGLFVINCMQDLESLTNSLIIDDHNLCHIQHGPSGPLYTFLNRYKQGNPIIVVNWSNFTLKQMVQANQLLDDTRKTDSMLVPERALIISLSSNPHLGRDMTSRHHDEIIVPKTLIIPTVSWPELTGDMSNVQHVIIDFYQDANWQPYLFGSYKLTANVMTFIPGTLWLALKNKPEALHITFKNAPMHRDDFRYTIYSLINEGKLSYQGQTLYLPKQIHITATQGFSFALEPIRPLLVRGYAHDYEAALNPESLSDFFAQYGYQQAVSAASKNTLTTLPGLIEAHRNQSLKVYLTKNLATASWAKLLNEAQRCHCQLMITLANNTDVPSKLQSLVCDEETIIEPHLDSSPARLIVSNDLEMAERDIGFESLKIVDVSELRKSNIFYRLNTFVQDQELIFNERNNSIWQAVLKGETVVLKGRFSQELASVLVPLFKPNGGLYYNGTLLKPKGKLIILTQDASLFNYVKTRENRLYTFEDRLALFSDEFKTYAKTHQKKIADYSLNQLNTLRQYFPYPHDPNEPWLPLHSLPPNRPDMSFDDLSETAAKNFYEGRLKQIFTAFRRMAIVFLSGKTGDGKSSFMHELNHDITSQTTVFFGDLKAWATATNADKMLILFIDEANLSHTDWSIFETLFNNPPFIIIDGHYYPLSDHHYVVFAGNPLSYKGTRNLPRLLSEHANVVTFGAMSNAYLFQKVLKPLIGDHHDIGKLFLKVFVCIKSIDEHSISARELQMMGFLFQARIKPLDDMMRAKQVALDMALNVLHGEKIPEFKAWFDAEFGVIETLPKTYPPKLVLPSSSTKFNEFTLTNNLHPLYDKLTDLIAVRDFKQTTTDKRVQSGGISGLVIEGNPGNGKSHFIKQYLLSYGFHEKKITEQDSVTIHVGSSKHFYYLPAGLSLDLKSKLLNLAFHEGAVVIVDEINASDMLELLELQINALLMGEDLDGKKATNPGFTLLGTQNSIAMAGRKEASLAVQRRLLHCIFPDYEPIDMHQIVMDKGLDRLSAYHLVVQYLEAKAINKDGTPTFRELMRRTTQLVDHKVELSQWIRYPKLGLALIDCLQPMDSFDQFLMKSIMTFGVEHFFIQDQKKQLYLTEKSRQLVSCDIPEPIHRDYKTTLRVVLYQLLEKNKQIFPGDSAFKDLQTHVYLLSEKKVQDNKLYQYELAKLDAEYMMHKTLQNVTEAKNNAKKILSRGHDLVMSWLGSTTFKTLITLLEKKYNDAIEVHAQKEQEYLDQLHVVNQIETALNKIQRLPSITGSTPRLFKHQQADVKHGDEQLHVKHKK